MKERLILSKREQKRLVVLNEVETGRMVVREAPEVLGISERQGWRILAAYREEGAAGLAHGNPRLWKPLLKKGHGSLETRQKRPPFFSNMKEARRGGQMNRQVKNGARPGLR